MGWGPASQEASELTTQGFLKAKHFQDTPQIAVSVEESTFIFL